MKIVCIGDSITYGYGVTRSKAWVTLAQEMLGVEIVNAGVNGDTTSGMLSRFDRSVLSHAPDIAVIAGGTNDFIAGADVKTIGANMMAMVHQAKVQFIMPFVGTPFPVQEEALPAGWLQFMDYNHVKTQIEAYCGWLEKLSKGFEVPLIDYYTQFDGTLADGLHPGEESQKKIAEIFVAAVEKYIE